MPNWFIYIAQAATGNYYVGISTDPPRRIIDHNRGKGSSMARAQGPFTLVYTSPLLANQSTARKLEIKIKRWPRRQKQKLIRGQIELSGDLLLKLLH